MIRYNKEKDEKEICLINIFKSINGECYNSGRPTVFVRTFGCNLRCSFCFAKDQSGNYPFVMNKYGQMISLNEIHVGDEILTKDPETNQTLVTRVVNVMEREADPDSIRRVEFGKTGYNSFNVTKEHPFYTNKWKPIGEIEVGEFVKRTQNADIVKCLVEVLFKDSLISYTKLAFDTYVKNHKDSLNFNSKNGMYDKDALQRNFMYVKNGVVELEGRDYPLAQYWGTSKLVVHHLDGNHDNDSLNNMVVIPKKIHDQLHARGNHFGKNNLPNLIELTKNEMRRKNKKYGNTVINIETDLHSYYVKGSVKGDAILVHNCDTKECWSKENFDKVYKNSHQLMWMTADEIVARVEEEEKNFKHKSICLTGGEPLLPENEPVIDELIDKLEALGYAIDVETDGGIDYNRWIKRHRIVKPDIFGNRCGMSLITDWKLPHSKMNKKMIESNLSILRPCDFIKCVISDDEDDWKEFERICKSGTKAKLYLSPCFGEVSMSKIPEFVFNHPEYDITAQIQAHKIFWDPKEKDV